MPKRTFLCSINRRDQTHFSTNFKTAKTMKDEAADDQQYPTQHSSNNLISKLAFFFLFLTVVLLAILSPPFEYSYPRKVYESATSSFDSANNSNTSDNDQAEEVPENCDLFTGEWIPDPNGPYYTNETCHTTHEYQNCMLHGRPDSDYLKWRWKPDSCDLPLFDPHKFLELVRGKSIGFVGDSMSRNQMQSLGCLLSRVTVPEDVSPPGLRDSQYWVYKDYNFSVSLYWSAYLIPIERPQGDNLHMYLDKYHEYWTSKINTFDYVIIAAGQWFPREPTKYFENGRLIGCYNCKESELPHLEFYTAYQKAYRTALRAIRELAKPEAVVFVRTISPSHFENGTWGHGGDCVRTGPFKRGETSLEPQLEIMRGVQLEELKRAREEGGTGDHEEEKGVKFRLMDVTESMLQRPDGHPGRYDRWQHEKSAKDCLHWCLPGPVDAWNDLLLQLMIRENRHHSTNTTTTTTTTTE